MSKREHTDPRISLAELHSEEVKELRAALDSDMVERFRKAADFFVTWKQVGFAGAGIGATISIVLFTLMGNAEAKISRAENKADAASSKCDANDRATLTALTNLNVRLAQIEAELKQLNDDKDRKGRRR